MILEWLFERRAVAAAQEQRSNWWESAVYLGDGSSSGVTVTPDTALTNSSVFACVRILAETIAALPLITYERQGKSRSRATEFYLYDILHDNPNEWMTSFEYRETLQGHLALWGNAYSQMDYDEAGQITSLFPLRPDRIHFIEISGGVKRYLYQLPSNEMVWLPGIKIWHLKAFGDGTFGYSPVELMKSGIGMSMALEKYGSKFFGNGARPGGVLEHPGKLGKEAHDRLRESWTEMHGGLENAHKVAILEEGLKWHEVGVPPGDSQFLEQRKFSVTDIARMYRVPPHMIADLEHATFSNIEHQAIEFVTHTMGPWLARWEQSIKKHLLTASERERYYCEFLVDSLLRGDTLSRYQAYQSGIQAGWFTRADAREKENLEPIEGLDQPLVPLNMAVAGEEQQDGQDEAGQDIQDGQDNQEGEGDEGIGEESNNRRESELVQERETRARGQASGRFRLARRQSRVFEDVARRIIRRESHDVKVQAKKQQPTPVFEGWLNEFYKEHAGWAAAQMLPAMLAYAEMVADRVADELDLDDLAGRTGPFVEAYAAEFGRRMAAKSLAKLLSLIKKPAATADDLLESIEEEVDGWAEAAANIGKEESVRENNAVALALYGQLGKEQIMSVATGESDCPYCADLDGQIIGINQYFLKEGQSFQPEGSDGPLNVGQSMRHAPYHEGCDCMTVSV